MHELMQKIKSELSSNSQNWLEHRVSNKNPKKIQPLVTFSKQIDQLTITQVRKQIRMINYIKKISQFHQFQLNLTKSPNRIQAKTLEFSIFHNAPN